MVAQVTWIYQSDDIDPAAVAGFEQSITKRYAAVSESRGFKFRAVNASELVPLCLGKPVLRYQGQDLLSQKQCFIVEDTSPDSQSHQALQAIYRTIAMSDSVLLNRSFDGPDYLERDKLGILQYAAKLGIPTAATISVPHGAYARRAIREVREAIGDGPYILKPREMSSGTGVLRIDSDQQLSSAIDIAAQTGAAYIIQPFIPHHADMRVFMADGEVVSSLSRRPKHNGYLASVSQGGSIEVNEDHLQVIDACRKIAASLHAEWICIDWLMTESGPLLNEWCTAYGGFTMMPEPELSQVADAFFGWIERKSGN
ncbi:RimK family alpha-L-glutamate ligase [Streptomyces seoulensis]|uniref:ATP-grasp domain-containing protein n=1 Tax=Streptomyces seoulensis TaxID=73044 RepID=UPI0036BB6FBC